MLEATFCTSFGTGGNPPAFSGSASSRFSLCQFSFYPNRLFFVAVLGHFIYFYSKTNVGLVDMIAFSFDSYG